MTSVQEHPYSQCVVHDELPYWTATESGDCSLNAQLAFIVFNLGERYHNCPLWNWSKTLPYVTGLCCMSNTPEQHRALVVDIGWHSLLPRITVTDFDFTLKVSVMTTDVLGHV